MKQKNHFPAVFVHGMFGWGKDEGIDKALPYWGASGGNLMRFLNENGYESYAVSVGPVSSAWDRACEMYACLTGTTVDYGKAHAERFHHRRFGRTYETALLPVFTKGQKIHLIGHSFGATTVRLFAHLLAFGSPEEREVTDDAELSELFRGGHADWLQSVVSVCGPHNGTTLFALAEKYKVTTFMDYFAATWISLAGRSPLQYRLVDFHLEQFGVHDSPAGGDRGPLLPSAHNIMTTKDNIEYEISPIGAMKINEITVPMIDSVYYFSYYFNTVEAGQNGKLSVRHADFKFLQATSNIILKSYKKQYQSGELSYDDLANDGLVNIGSAKHPHNQPFKQFDPDHLEPGIWQVMPERRGDHGSAIGLFSDVVQTHVFYTTMLQLLASLEPQTEPTQRSE